MLLILSSWEIMESVPSTFEVAETGSSGVFEREKKKERKINVSLSAVSLS